MDTTPNPASQRDEARAALNPNSRTLLDKQLYDSLGDRNKTPTAHTVALLINKGADPNYSPYGEDEDTPLTLALAHCSPEIISILVAGGANPEKGYHRVMHERPARTGLGVAIERGSPELVRILVNEGKADVKRHVGQFGNSASPLHAAVELSARGIGLAGSKAMNATSPADAIAISKILLESGADINAFHGTQGDKHGQGTVLQTACSTAANDDAVQLIRFLLDNGANVNTPRGGVYDSPLQAAARRASPAVVKLLLERGADVNAIGGEAGSPLDAAKKRGNKEITSLLEEKGAKKRGFVKGFFTMG